MLPLAALPEFKWRPFDILGCMSGRSWSHSYHKHKCIKRKCTHELNAHMHAQTHTYSLSGFMLQHHNCLSAPLCQSCSRVVKQVGQVSVTEHQTSYIRWEQIQDQPLNPPQLRSRWSATAPVCSSPSPAQGRGCEAPHTASTEAGK